MQDALLRIRGLTMTARTTRGPARILSDIHLEIGRGRILGIVGESGSGKSSLASCLLRLLPPNLERLEGRVELAGTDLLALPDAAMAALRGTRIAMVFQDPMMTLNPVLKVGLQIVETIQAHEKVAPDEARRRAREALVAVGIPSPDERLEAYPHQLSGGMRQRVAIAIALVNKPDLIIADEPTTALDVTIQGQILAEVQKLARDTGTALVWITHDLGVVAGLSDRIAVMYGGRVVEQGTTDDILERPVHPYTVGLLGSLPTRQRAGEPLVQIPGMAPSLLKMPEGCAFRPRCPRASGACIAVPEIRTDVPGREYRCFHPHAMTAEAAA